MRRLTPLLASAFLVCGPTVTAFALPVPRLVADLNQAPPDQPRASSPDSFVRLDHAVLFRGLTAQEGSELWRSDGTPAGTQLVEDLCPRCNGDPHFLAASSERAFFTAYSGSGGRGVWVTDGTAVGTFMLPVQFVSSTSPSAAWLEAVDRFVFEGLGPDGRAPWISDGTVEGTQRLADLSDDPDVSYHAFQATENAAYFLRFEPNQPRPYTLFATDGTAGGTHGLGTFDLAGSRDSFPMTRDRLFFGVLTHPGTDIWTSTGTLAGTRSLRALVPALGAFSFLTIETATPDYVLFTAGNAGTDTQLWMSDGTAAGTRRLISGLGRWGREMPQSYIPASHRLFFTWWNAALGEELWVTDTTPGGTHLVRDLCPGVCDSEVFESGTTNGKLVFVREIAFPVYERWATDGTDAGTRLLIHACGHCASAGGGLGHLGATLFLRTEVGVWRTDGTAAGTYAVSSPDVRSFYTGAESPTGSLLFQATRSADLGGRELWEARDAVGSVAQVKDINDDAAMGFDFSRTTALGDSLLFWTQLDEARATAWSTGGNQATTVELIPPAPAEIRRPGPTAVLGDRAILTALGSSRPLWATDGTPAGTALLRSFGSGDGPCSLQVFDDRAYFFSRASGPVSPSDLWRTDGTVAGTGIVAADVGGAECSRSTAVLGDQMLFFGTDWTLFVTDGTSAGTRPIKELFSGHLFENEVQRAGGKVYFVATEDGDHPLTLWETDGTTAGTRSVPASPEFSRTSSYGLAALGDVVYFAKSGPTTPKSCGVPTAPPTVRGGSRRSRTARLPS